MGRTVGVVLAGCGFRDGSELHESVGALLALDRAGAKVRCFAPDVELEVVDHLTGERTGEQRNARVEAARIARGEVEDLAGARAEELDALLFPGGYGAAKVLSDFAARGAECAVLPDIERLIRAVHAAGKPIGALCIAPVLVARALGERGPTLTIGGDADVAAALEAMGARHRECSTTGVVVDAENKLVSTPAYMLGTSLKAVQAGIEQAVDALLDLIG